MNERGYTDIKKKKIESEMRPHILLSFKFPLLYRIYALSH